MVVRYHLNNNFALSSEWRARDKQAFYVVILGLMPSDFFHFALSTFLSLHMWTDIFHRTYSIILWFSVIVNVQTTFK